MDNLGNVIIGLMLCCSIALLCMLPSTHLFVQRHPWIAVVWLTTVLAITTALIVRIRSALDITGIFVFIVLLLMTGAALVEIDQHWHTPKRMVTLLLGVSVIAFVGMVALGAFL